MENRKIILAIFLALFLVANVSAQDPRHPLSQIYPIDIDLEMEAQDIRNVSQLQLNDGLGEKGLLLEGYNISGEGESQKIVLDYQNDEWDVLNSNVNMNGNNITGIDTLLFESGMKINGSINTSGGDVNLENGSINDVYSIDGGGDPVNFFDPIDMNGNPLLDSDGNLEIQGEVYLRDGPLDMAGNNIVNPANVDGVDLDDPGDGIGITDSRYEIIEDAIGNSELNNSQEFTADGLVLTSNLNMTGNDIETGGGNIAVIDTANNQDIARLKEGGNVQIPNGNVDVAGPSNTGKALDVGGGIHVEGNIDLNGNDIDSSGTSVKLTSDTANNYVALTDEGQSGDLLRVNNGNGNGVSIHNENLNLNENNIENVNGLQDGSGANTIVFDGSNNVGIPNGNVDVAGPSNTGRALDLGGGANFDGVLDMNQNNVAAVDSLLGSSNEPLELSVSGSGGQELVLDNSGDVQVQNGDLDLRGNSVVDTTSSNTVYIGDGNDDTVVMDAPGNVEFGGDLDLSSASIINYYDPACPQGKTIADIKDDGSFQCVDIAEEVTDVYVNRSGDTMTGDLNMLGNQVKNVSRLGVGTANPQENLDVDGTASIENSGTRMEVDSTGDVVVTLGP
ncbi:MAG: hypothetical protein BRC27_01455 [Nanohaloarchaea archaeon SW_10_44_10]|nr:MAG: hypothetical protein BRC27_01455 [Nanohaloarchaea archaeon SW_10_44_10]